MKPLPFLGLLALFVGWAGCASNLSSESDLPSDDVDDSRTDTPIDESAARAGGKLDLLIVMDASASMHEEQVAVQQAIEGFVGSLTFAKSLHVGVVTPDIGLGTGYPDPLCAKSGTNDGMLHVRSEQPNCSWATDSYISDTIHADGTYEANYPWETEMTFAEAFSCLADVGTSGCGFEQPIEAANLALDGRNPGFRRADAALAVIFVSDEDDCSADDSSLFDPDTAVLGPLHSFRCARFGMTCDQDVDSAGAKTGCDADEESAYLQSMTSAAASLAANVENPSDLFVATLVGPSGDVSVREDTIQGPGGDSLQVLAVNPSCTGFGGEAAPGVRFASFTEAVIETGASTAEASICQTSESLATISAMLGDFMQL